MRLPVATSFLGMLIAGCGPGIDPQLVRNPICDISAVLTWTTEDPASSWVEVSQDGGPLFRIGSDELVTEHEVIVVGMHARQAYELEAVSHTESGRELRSEQQRFGAGDLPDDWMQGELTHSEPDRVQSGWVLTNLMVASYSPVIVQMLDEDGLVVWYYVHGGKDGGADIQPSWYPEQGEVLVGPHVAGGDHSLQMDLKGEISWLGPEQPGDPDAFNIQDGQLHHVLYGIENGDRISVQSEYQTVDGDEVQGDRVVQLDQDNNEVWSWSAFDHIPYDPDDVYLGVWWTHINSVAVDLDEDVAWINSWVHSKTWKVDRTTGEVLWALGAGGDFTAPDHEAPWFAFAHSVDPIGDGHFLIHDNGFSTRGSRLVEYALDESTMSAEIVWEYDGADDDDEWYVASCGDVDLLPNGNRFAVAHRNIIEVTEDGEKVWDYRWIPASDTPDLRSYQAEKIEALVEPL